MGRASAEWTIITVLSAALFPPAVFAQTRFHTDVNLVSLGVRVTDKGNRDIRDLRVSDFELLEDGTPQRIAIFDTDEQPITLGVLLDTSGSMAGKKLEQARAAVKDLFAVFGQRNEIFYMEFNDQPGNIVERVESAGGITHGLPAERKARENRAGTALYDAVAVALCRLRTARTRRQALLVITDGADQHSRISIDDLLTNIRSSPAQVFVVGYFSSDELSVFSRGERTVPLVSGRDINNPFFVFQRLATESGAECFFPGTANGLKHAVEQVAMNLRTQYTLSYYSPSSAKPPRRIEIRVHRSGLKAKSRRIISNDRVEMASSSAGCAISPVRYPYPFEKHLSWTGDRLIYHDDFTDSASGWPKTTANPAVTDFEALHLGVKGDGYIRRAYGKDGYQLIHEASDDSEGVATIAAYGPSWRTFKATLKLRLDSTASRQLASRNSAGLVFRMNDIGYYALLIASGGSSRDVYYKLIRREFKVLQAWDLIGWTHATDFDTTRSASWRRIGVDCEGDKITLFVDDVPVQVARDSHMESGLIGTALYGTGRATFRDLAVESMPDAGLRQ